MSSSDEKISEVSRRKFVKYGVGAAVVAAAAAIGGYAAWQAGQPPASTKPKMKVAMVVAEPIENAFGAESYRAFQAIQHDFVDVSYAYTDKIDPPDYEKILSAYANEGYDLVYLSGFTMSDAIWKVANALEQTTKTMFVNGIGAPPADVAATDIPSNLLFVQIAEWETGYVGGLVAALLSKTGKIGSVIGADYPMLVALGNGFKLGARYINPNIDSTVVYVGNWSDPQKGKAMANALIDSGVDVIFNWGNGSGFGVLDAVKERGVIAIGEILDQMDYAPDNVATSVLLGIYDVEYWSMSEFIKGTLQTDIESRGRFISYGLKDGLKPLGKWNTKLVPKEVIDKVEATIEAVRKGDIVVPSIMDRKL